MIETNPLEKLVAGCLTLVLTPFSLLTYAWVTAKMWAWFITPTFGIAAPSLAILAGLWVIQTLFHRPDWAAYELSQENTPSTAFGRFFAGAFIQPLLALFIGWIIVTLFI